MKESIINIFHHIPKCGGTSVNNVLAKWFNPVRDYRKGHTLNYPDKIDLEALSPSHCITGHFELEGFHLKQRYPEAFTNDNCRIFSFIRDPLGVKLSLFHYERMHNVGIANLEEHLFSRRNYISSIFPLNDENYKQVLNQYYFIGILEYPEVSINLLATLLEKPKIQLPWKNKSIRNKNQIPITDKIIEKFKDENKLDYKVYNYCLQKFNKLRQGI
ncbi:MAG: sulfotransferase family protein [Lentisphaerales bacterium]|nr:sulfotransferase family protein [Lentisphaerales bacterium]